MSSGPWISCSFFCLRSLRRNLGGKRRRHMTSQSRVHWIKYEPQPWTKIILSPVDINGTISRYGAQNGSCSSGIEFLPRIDPSPPSTLSFWHCNWLGGSRGVEQSCSALVSLGSCYGRHHSILGGSSTAPEIGLRSRVKGMTM